MTENKLSGQVHIADEVIAAIAGAAVLESDGVVGRKRPSKSITLKVENEKVSVSVDIAISSGVKIQDVAKDVQQRIKNAIETMTGFTLIEVNVNVAGLVV